MAGAYYGVDAIPERWLDGSAESRRHRGPRDRAGPALAGRAAHPRSDRHRAFPQPQGRRELRTVRLGRARWRRPGCKPRSLTSDPEQSDSEGSAYPHTLVLPHPHSPWLLDCAPFSRPSSLVKLQREDAGDARLGGKSSGRQGSSCDAVCGGPPRRSDVLPVRPVSAGHSGRPRGDESDQATTRSGNSSTRPKAI